MDEIQAAQSLVQQLNAPPQSHSVYVRTTLDKDKNFVKQICVSIHPTFLGQVTVPKTIEGYSVEQTEWPKEQR